MIEWESSGKSQLRMGFRRFELLEPPRMPPGYALRTFRSGDEVAWIAMLNTGEFRRWDRQRLEHFLAGERAAVPRDGIFFATYDDRPVASACTCLHAAPGGDVPEVGWVIADPEHRGHGLALQVCRAVLGYMGNLGHDYAYLLTEDFRVPALATYLKLGFEPEMQDETQPARWAAIRRLVARAESG
jgi:mycothiol synthase